MSGLTPEQIAARRSYIGGTDAARIMKGEWRDLWLEKTGRREPADLSGVLAVQMGITTEEFNARWFEKQTGRAVADRRLHVKADPPLPAFMACNLDGISTTARGEPAVWDAKHVGKAGDTTVERYTPQMTHNALVCGLSWWVISFFVGNSKWEMIEQEVDPFFAEELLTREAEFWRYVETDEEPQDRIATEAPKPARYRTVDLAEANRARWPNWGGRFIELVDAFAGTKAAADRHFATREELKSLLPEDVGLVTRGLFTAKRSRTGSITLSLGKAKTDD